MDVISSTLIIAQLIESSPAQQINNSLPILAEELQSV